jgi:hypothetical protein
MSDLLFIEIGAAVTEVLGATRCTFEPFRGLEPPTYAAARRIEADFARTLDSVLGTGAQAEYDQFVGPTDPTGRPLGSPPIGPSWPGGTYEGVVRIREDIVSGNSALAAAAAAQSGRPYEYQVVASIDEQTGAVRRYHGFYAEVLRTQGSAFVLRVAHGGTSAAPRWSPQEVIYDPADTTRFYSGGLVPERGIVVGGGSGAVFIALGVASSVYLLEVPKLPVSAGL